MGTDPQERETSPAEPGSVLAEITQRRNQLRTRKKRKTLEIPGYGGALLARFRPCTYEELYAYRTTLSAADELEADADTLISTCEAILVRKDDKLASITPGSEPFDPEDDKVEIENPVRFGPELAKLLAFEAESAREALFGVYPSEIAVGEAATTIVRWSRNVDQEVDDKLMGESEGGTNSS